MSSPAWPRERRKAIEAALVLGDLDPFPFILAKEYGWTLAQIRAMPNSDLVALRAWTIYERGVRRLQANHQAALARLA